MWITAAKFALSGVLGPAWLAKLIGVGASILAVVSSILIYGHNKYKEGWNDHVLAIATENTQAVKRNSDLLAIVRGCKSRGLRFNQTTRQCDGNM